MAVVDPQTWTWNEPDGAEQVGSDEDAARNIEASENPLNSAVEEQNIWDELLRARYEVFGALTFFKYAKLAIVNIGMMYGTAYNFSFNTLLITDNEMAADGRSYKKRKK